MCGIGQVCLFVLEFGNEIQFIYQPVFILVYTYACVCVSIRTILLLCVLNLWLYKDLREWIKEQQKKNQIFADSNLSIAMLKPTGDYIYSRRNRNC